MADNRQTGNGTPKPHSPQVSTRSRDEIEKDIHAMRDRLGESGSRPDPKAVREKAHDEAVAHRDSHSGTKAEATGSSNYERRDHDASRREPVYDRDPAYSRETYRDPDLRDRPVESRRYDSADGDKSSAELEREVERERYELTRTLDQLRNRVSPGQIMDQALGYARDAGAGEFTHNLSRSVRENPLPVLLVGAGLGWLMISSNSGPSHRGAYYDDKRRYDSSGRDSGMGSQLADRASQAAHAVSETVSGAAAAVRDGMHNAADRASSAYEAAGDAGRDLAGKARGAMHRGSDEAHGMADKARGAAHWSGDEARGAANRAGAYAHDARAGMQDGFSRMAEEHPIALGAVGLAVGAAIAAMLPTSRIENRLMGPTSDALKDQVKDSAERQYEHAREVAQDTAKEISEEFEKRGVSTEAIAGAAAGAARKAGDAAKDVAQSAKSEVKQKADETDTDKKVSYSSGTSTSQPKKTPGSTGNTGGKP